jgi:hypothetical protein
MRRANTQLESSKDKMPIFMVIRKVARSVIEVQQTFSHIFYGWPPIRREIPETALARSVHRTEMKIRQSPLPELKWSRGKSSLPLHQHHKHQ